MGSEASVDNFRIRESELALKLHSAKSRPE